MQNKQNTKIHTHTQDEMLNKNIYKKKINKQKNNNDAIFTHYFINIFN